MIEAVIVSAVRTAVGRAPRGFLSKTRPEYLGAVVVNEAIARVPGLLPEEIEDVIIGNSYPEGEQGLNLGRIVALRAGLPLEVSGQTVNRFCASGLQAIATAVQQVQCGMGDVMVAGGVECMSCVPIGGGRLSPDPYLIENLPGAYMPMGITAEKVAQRFAVSREDQDLFALNSHQKAARAIKEGLFKEEIVPIKVAQTVTGEDGRPVNKEVFFSVDEGVRSNTAIEGLAKLKPIFKVGGTVTAGNASQTSDGASAVVVMSAKKASEIGVKPIAILRSFAVGGCDPEVMGLGPTVAIPKALKMAGLNMNSIDLVELNEAFAAQALAVIREVGLNPEIVNVNGGAIALGHPLGCTGAKLSTQILYEMSRRKLRYGLVSMCIGGGMGAAGVFERLN